MIEPVRVPATMSRTIAQSRGPGRPGLRGQPGPRSLLTDVSVALRLGRSGVYTRTGESSLLADLGELTPCEPPPSGVSLRCLPGPQVPVIEPFSLEHVAPAIAGHPRVAGRAPGNAAVPALNTSGSLARSAPATAVTLPVPGGGDAFPGAAGAAAAVPENESKSTPPLRRAELESEK